MVYPGALGPADLVYRISLAGAESDVVFRRRLPKPQDLQLDEKLVRVECWSEVLESPAPRKSVGSVRRADGSVDTDETLDFGPMQMNAGNAFSVGEATGSPRITKLWQQTGGTNCLIESVPYRHCKKLRCDLPEVPFESTLDLPSAAHLLFGLMILSALRIPALAVVVVDAAAGACRA